MKKLFYAMALGLMTLAGSAGAATVNYLESAQGDLVGGAPFSQLTNIGILGLGTNTVSGNVGTRFPGTTVSDSDQFLFEIAGGTRLSSVVFHFSNVSGLSGMQMKIWEILDINNNVTGSQSYEQLTFASGFGQPISTSPVNLFQAFFPVGTGLFKLGVPTAFGSTGDWNLDYSYQLNVSQVPLPAALPMLLVGLAGLGWIGRRKKA